MTINLPLQPQEEARLIAAAKAMGFSTDELVREALHKVLAGSLALEETPRTESCPIWEVMLDNIKDVSAEEFAVLPTDGPVNTIITLTGTSKKRTMTVSFADNVCWIKSPTPV
jgi:hypothetical protein